MCNILQDNKKGSPWRPGLQPGGYTKLGLLGKKGSPIEEGSSSLHDVFSHRVGNLYVVCVDLFEKYFHKFIILFFINILQ